jgi:hypothetical protein
MHPGSTSFSEVYYPRDQAGGGEAHHTCDDVPRASRIWCSMSFGKVVPVPVVQADHVWPVTVDSHWCSRFNRCILNPRRLDLNRDEGTNRPPALKLGRPSNLGQKRGPIFSSPPVRWIRATPQVRRGSGGDVRFLPKEAACLVVAYKRQQSVRRLLAR